ncbi:MAG TPA: DUF979 domain-containing protein [Tissierellaceae bacterium]|nr:DUF979 domain-containing protein [Tissierellaceae bacterium]
MDLNTLIGEIFFSIIGIIFIICGIYALRDKELENRIPTAIFWFILAFTFIVGPYIPNWITGVCILIIAGITAFDKVQPAKTDEVTEEETRKNADKLGYKVFIPVISLAIIAVVVAYILVPLNLSTNHAIGISAVFALIITFIITKAPGKYAVSDGSRLMMNVGPVGILPQLLAALGALFTAAGVGDVIANGVSAVIPMGNKLLGVVAYCIGMALFTIIMGNGFAAFSVITVGIGIPFVISQGADPIVVGALGLTAGYCGTLLTPMAANFNIMPAALLETKDKNAIIKAQAPFAITMLIIHIILMYIFAF